MNIKQTLIWWELKNLRACDPLKKQKSQDFQYIWFNGTYLNRILRWEVPCSNSSSWCIMNFDWKLQKQVNTLRVTELITMYYQALGLR